MSAPNRSEPDLFGRPHGAAAPSDPVAWFCWRLAQHGVDVEAWTVDGVRAALLEHGACVICGRGPDGKPESYGARFERVFGEALSQPVSRGTRPRSTQQRGGALR